jgi:putative DNA primase/helicase
VATDRQDGAHGRSPEARGETPRQRLGRLIVGRLQEHGRATYQFRPQESLSYFVKVLTNRGERILWGKDLERAIAASATQPKVGDLIGARRIGREAVTITARQRDSAGRVVSQSEHYAHRNRWVVEKIAFFAERARMARRVRDAQADVRRTVRSQPELMSTYLSLRGAQEIAERRIADPRDRERFLTLVREAIAGSIKQGEPLPAVRIRERQQPAVKNPSALRARKRDDGPTR